MRRLLPVLLAVSATSVAAPPASAFPPATVSGSGTISPGLTFARSVHSLSFYGTATLPTGTSYACTLYGSGSNLTPTELTGFIGGQGTQCGLGIGSESCPFELTPTTFKVVCPTSQFIARASYSDLDPTTRFTATGLIL